MAFSEYMNFKVQTFWEAQKIWKKIFLMVWTFTNQMYKAWVRLHKFLCASQKFRTLQWPSNVKKNCCTPFFENLLFDSVLEMPRKKCPPPECTPFFWKRRQIKKLKCDKFYQAFEGHWCDFWSYVPTYEVYQLCISMPQKPDYMQT